MKKLLTCAATLFLGIVGFTASAQDEDAVVSQISDLQWMLTWEDCEWINLVNQYADGPYLMAVKDSKITSLTYAPYGYPDYNKANVQFPMYGNYITINLENANLPAGDYILTIPAEFLRLKPKSSASFLNEETSYWLTIGGGVTVEHAPSFSEIWGNYFDITFENVTTLNKGNATGAYMINQDTQVRYEMQYLQGEQWSKYNLVIDNTSLRVNLTNGHPDLPDGTYKLFIPANYVLFNGSKTDGNAPIEYEFNYVSTWSEGSVEFTGPGAGDILTVKWLTATSVELNPSFQPDGVSDITGVTIQDWDGDDGNVTVPNSDFQISGNTMTISLAKLNLKNGQYRLYIPEEFVNVTNDKGTYGTDGVYEVFDYTNGIDDPADQPQEKLPLYEAESTWNIPMEDGDYIVNYGQFIEVSWPGTTLAAYDGRNDEAGIYNPEQGFLTLEFGKEVTISEDKTKLLLNLGNLPTDIYNSISIPEAYVYVYKNDVTYLNQGTGVYESAIFVYNEEKPDAGVESIGTDLNGRYIVYNLNGIKVLDTDNASVLENLPKGFYIINGKKVVKN